ncbi:MAG: dihydroorotate dehydrogenase [Candidatus Gastranaerophilales bacterium]|nr:dihydroorotate dehydrogenase [Candidatus Gastranaerophilales bacterium]
MGLDILKTVLKNEKSARTYELKTPIIGASGTYGYVDEYEDFIDLNKFGAISTKGITLEKRPGNSGDRIFEVTNGMINRIGLENVGIQSFLLDKLPKLRQKKINFMLNIAGSTTEDYERLAAIANEYEIEALEVNVSCPNVKQGCLEFGLNPNALFELTKKIRQKYHGFLIVKLSPNTQDIKPLATAVEQGGADCISAINTLRGLGVKVDLVNNKFVKKTVQGGLSGACIKPVALYMINQIKQVVKIPVIAMGGIMNLNDLLEFMAVGADAFQIGTANFINPGICSDLATDLEKYILDNGFKNFEELKGAIQNG